MVQALSRAKWKRIENVVRLAQLALHLVKVYIGVEPVLWQL